MKLVATLYFDTEMAIKNASYHAVVLSYTNISPCLSDLSNISTHCRSALPRTAPQRQEALLQMWQQSRHKE